MIYRPHGYSNDLLLILMFRANQAQAFQLQQMLARQGVYGSSIKLWHAISLNVNDKSIITTHQSILHKIDGFILYPLTQIPTYSRQWFIAEVWDPGRNVLH